MKNMRRALSQSEMSVIVEYDGCPVCGAVLSSVAEQTEERLMTKTGTCTACGSEYTVDYWGGEYLGGHQWG